MVTRNQDKTQSLLSYKYYIRPIARRLYGNTTSESKHQQNVQRILKILALEGPMTTWDMAKIRFPNDIIKLRTKEKEYRRILIGRTDRGRHSEGILDLNLVVVDSKSTKRNQGNVYRLSLFGILYCLDTLDLKKNEIDVLAKKYEVVIPLIFGKWDFLKSQIGESVYNLSLLGKGMMFDNLNVIKIQDPKFYGLISYFNTKANQLSHSFNEQKIGELISLWFYVTLLYLPNLMKKTKNKNHDSYLKKVLKHDPELQIWFSDFIDEARTFYNQRSKILESISIG